MWLNILLNLRRLGLGVVSFMLRINLMSTLVLLMVSGLTLKGWLNCMLHTLEDAYRKALEVEKFNKPSSFVHTGPSMSSNSNTRPKTIKSQESSLRNSLPVASPIEYKASNLSIVYHKYHHKGHIASRYP